MIARRTALATAGVLVAGAMCLVSASRPQGAVRTYYIAADTV